MKKSGHFPSTAFSTTTFTPLRSAEEIANRFGLDAAIADLERLFSSSPSSSAPSSFSIATGGGPHPPFLDGASRGRRRPPVRVAYQGVRGSYCQEAAARAFSSFSGGVDAFPCSDGMEGAFAALELRDADRAVVPMENSLDGPIPRNLDLLLRHSPAVRIVGEIVLPVNHCLLSLPGSASRIRRVVSHPQALSHCRERLEAMGVDEVDEVHDAAAAARYVAENRIGDTAVIGSEMAAREFGLDVVRSNFQDRPGNYNRFLQLGLAGAAAPSSAAAPVGWKTTVAFSLEKGPSDLFQAMFAFESRGVAVDRVEHRPNRSNPIRLVAEEEGKGAGNGARPQGYFDYVFILDVVGSESDPKVKAAIARLREIAGFVRVLGSYATCEEAAAH